MDNELKFCAGVALIILVVFTGIALVTGIKYSHAGSMAKYGYCETSIPGISDPVWTKCK